MPTLNTDGMKEERPDPRAVRTRKLLIDAFQNLLAEKSFEEITVQDISRRATVNRATFYAHFADKYALGNDIMRQDFDVLMKGRLTGSIEDPHQYLRSLLLAVTDHWAALNTHCKKSFRLFESLVEPQVKALLRENILAWLQTHGAVYDGSPQHREMLATILGWAIYGAAQQWTQIRRTESPESFADRAVPVIAAGLGESVALSKPAPRTE